MKHFTMPIVILVTILLISCGSDKSEESTVTETFSAIVTSPIDGTYEENFLEQYSASEIAKWIPCEITSENKEITIDKGGSETCKYILTLNKWRNADLSIITNSVKSLEVFSVDYTTYTFTPGEYDLLINGVHQVMLVKEDGVYLLNNKTHEEMTQLIHLNNCRRTYKVFADTPLRTYNQTESSSYFNHFTLRKLTDDHFYIENDDYTFESHITTKGIRLSEIKPVEKEIGLL